MNQTRCFSNQLEAKAKPHGSRPFILRLVPVTLTHSIFDFNFLIFAYCQRVEKVKPAKIITEKNVKMSDDYQINVARLPCTAPTTTYYCTLFLPKLMDNFREFKTPRKQESENKGHRFSRDWRWLYVFPRLVPVV